MLGKLVALKPYERYVREGTINPKRELWRNLKNQIFLGSEDFIFRINGNSNDPQDLSEVPLAQLSESVRGR